jgi:fructokinase
VSAVPAPDGADVVAVVGEALVDFVQAGPEPYFEAFVGGSPANVAVGLARLGTPVRLAARISADPLGRRIRRHLDANGVDLSHAVAAAEHSTLAIVGIGEDGGADYDFRVEGTADWQWHDGELEQALGAPVAAVHSGSLALTMAPGADVVLTALTRGRATATISYDPNCRPLLMGARDELLARVERILALADVVKASADDIAWLLPGTSPEEAAEEWLTRGPAIVAITLGADGAVAASREAGVVRRPGLAVQVADTIGAGDSFTSTLLAGLRDRSLLGAAQRDALERIDAATLGELLEEAVLASAFTCTRRGPEPPTRAELAAFLDRVHK